MISKLFVPNTTRSRISRSYVAERPVALAGADHVTSQWVLRGARQGGAGLDGDPTPLQVKQADQATGREERPAMVVSQEIQRGRRAALGVDPDRVSLWALRSLEIGRNRRAPAGQASHRPQHDRRDAVRRQRLRDPQADARASLDLLLEESECFDAVGQRAGGDDDGFRKLDRRGRSGDSPRGPAHHHDVVPAGGLRRVQHSEADEEWHGGGAQAPFHVRASFRLMPGDSATITDPAPPLRE
jgi:hypothetical protein